jgi:hypothetical protein
MTSATFTDQQLGLYAESAPPIDLADRLMASIPQHMGIGMAQRATKVVAELDKCVCLSVPHL